jgi:hypothetical protein
MPVQDTVEQIRCDSSRRQARHFGRLSKALAGHAKPLSA